MFPKLSINLALTVMKLKFNMNENKLILGHFTDEFSKHVSGPADTLMPACMHHVYRPTLLYHFKVPHSLQRSTCTHTLHYCYPLMNFNNKQKQPTIARKSQRGETWREGERKREGEVMMMMMRDSMRGRNEEDERERVRGGGST